MASALPILATLVLLSLPFAHMIAIGPVPIDGNVISVPITIATNDPIAITTQTVGGGKLNGGFCLGGPTPFVNAPICAAMLGSAQTVAGFLEGYDSTGSLVPGTPANYGPINAGNPFTITITKTVTQWEVVFSQGTYTSSTFTFPFYSDPSPNVITTLYFTAAPTSAPQLPYVATGISFPLAISSGIVPSSGGFHVPVTEFDVGQSVTLTVFGTGRIFFGGPVDESGVGLGFLVGTSTIQLLSTQSTTAGTIYEGSQVHLAVSSSQPYSVTIKLDDAGYSLLVQQGTYTRSLCWPVFVTLGTYPSSITNVWFVPIGSLKVYSVLFS